MLKTLIAALVVASAAFTTVATAGPRGQAPESLYYIDRASQNHDNGGN